MRPYQDFIKKATAGNLNLQLCIKTNKKGDETWSDNILTLDIEATSAWLDCGKVLAYHPHETEEFWNSKQAVHLPYIWQFSFDDEVYYGREFEDFQKILTVLVNSAPTHGYPEIHYRIYVHNLAYEFESMCNFMSWKSVFARSTHSPMKAVPLMWPQIEFCCSYYLTRLSLEEWGNDLGCHKLVGNLDYRKLRTPYTDLTQDEMDYAERDCKVVYEGIKRYREKYEHVFNIPLTQTGEIRRVIKELIQKDEALHNKIIKLLPKDAKMYRMMRQAFQGGYTHANMNYAGRTVNQDFLGAVMGDTQGYAFDFASSYPAVMVSEKFPMTPFRPDMYDPKKTATTAYLLEVEFINGIEPKMQNHYISKSKMYDYDPEACEFDNGRLISASCSFKMTCTEVDMSIIRDTYKPFKYNVIECYSSVKEYLPKCLVEYILELYGNKTMYKDVPGKEAIYQQAKQYINSLFGMCVTALLNEEITFDQESMKWGKINSTEEMEDNAIAALKEKKNRHKTFLAYQWGVWITAYARRNLWDCLMACDKYELYADTDSLKLCKKIDFSWYNNRVMKKIKACCKFYGIDPKKARPMSPDVYNDDGTIKKKGREKPLGIFAEEDPWTEFKTLGAKRYVYRAVKDGKLHLTISGISKAAVVCLKDDIENFNENMVFDKDYYDDLREDIEAGNGTAWNSCYTSEDFETVTAEYSIHNGTKNMHLYTHNDDPITFPDGYVSYWSCGIAMRPTSYSMDSSSEYFELIGLTGKK